MRRPFCVLTIVILAVALGPAMVGADGGQPTLVHACVDLATGGLRIVEPGVSCAAHETARHWPESINGDVGIGLGPQAAVPGQRLHIGDGNVLVEGGGETAILFKRDDVFAGGASGDSPNPIFQVGRVQAAGDGDPELRILYEDDNIRLSCPQPECARSVLKVDRKGIVASVKPGPGSHFEGFIESVDQGVPRGDVEPVFRLNSFPSMQLEMGPGGDQLTDVIIRRASANTIAVLIGNGELAVERLRISPTGVRVVGGYLQVSTVAGPPPASDCNSSAHAGRLTVSTDGPPGVFVCLGARGWVKR